MPIFKRILSGMLSLTIAVSAVPVITTYADESTEPYPYTMFAASSDEGAITVNASNQLLISALPGADKSIFEEIAEEVGADIVGYIALTNDYQFEFKEQKTLEEISEIAEYIDSYSFVSSVTLNIVSEGVTEYTSNDTMYIDGLTCSKQWIDTDGDGITEHHADYKLPADKWDSTNPSGDNWNLEAMNVPDAWDLVDSTHSVRVGVYDAAFDYADDGSTVASLDLDDTSSYGPETITLHLDSSLLTDGAVFRYSVHDYSDGSSTTTTNLATSNAVIHLYKGNTLLNTYHVPQNETGSVWHVFDIDSTGIHAVNSFYGAWAGDVK